MNDDKLSDFSGVFPMKLVKKWLYYSQDKFKNVSYKFR